MLFTEASVEGRKLASVISDNSIILEKSTPNEINYLQINENYV